jgi:hypothetical protein
MILPDDVLTLIRDYARPMWTRPDWRYCKRGEADHIFFAHAQAIDAIPMRIDYDDVLEEVQGWSLFGKFWLLRADDWQIVAPRRPPLIPPPETMEDYVQWYTRRIQWLHG